MKDIVWAVPFQSETTPPIIYRELPVHQTFDIGFGNSTPKIAENTPSIWFLTYGCDSFLDLMPIDKGLVYTI